MALPDLFVGANTGSLGSSKTTVRRCAQPGRAYHELPAVGVGMVSHFQPRPCAWRLEWRRQGGFGGGRRYSNPRPAGSSGDFSGAPTAISTTLTVPGSKAVPALADLTGTGARICSCCSATTLSAFIPIPAIIWSRSARPASAPTCWRACPKRLWAGRLRSSGLGWLAGVVSDDLGRIWEFQPATGVYTLRSKVFGGTYAGFAHRLTISACDFDGDGDVDLFGRVREGGLVYLKNPAMHLIVSPPSVTVTVSQPVTFDVLNTVFPPTWRLLRNQSGGAIDPVTGAYQSGATGGVVDFLEAVDALVCAVVRM